jgi:hypothetical protein
MDHSISTLDLSINSVCVCSLIIAAKAFALIESHHIAPIIIETVQIMSYIGAFVVSCFTVYNFISKKFKK